MCYQKILAHSELSPKTDYSKFENLWKIWRPIAASRSTFLAGIFWPKFQPLSGLDLYVYAVSEKLRINRLLVYGRSFFANFVTFLRYPSWHSHCIVSYQTPNQPKTPTTHTHTQVDQNLSLEHVLLLKLHRVGEREREWRLPNL